MKILTALSLLSLVSCTQYETAKEAYKAMPDDNPIEEGIEWGLETGVEFVTGKRPHIDLSGDSEEKKRD